MLVFWQFLIPLSIGILLGLIGGGGSVLTLPFLIYIIGQNTKEAIATSLFAVGFASLIGAIFNAFKSNIVFTKSIFFGLWGMLASYLSARFWVPFISDELQIRIFAILVLVIASLMLFKKHKDLGDDNVSTNRIADFLGVCFSGIFVGTITGIVGVGGGFLIVPALHYFLKMPMNKAIGSSLLVIAMQAFAGFMAYQKEFILDIDFIIHFSSLLGIGSLLGSFASSKIHARILQKIFAVILLIIGLSMIIVK